MPDRHAVTPTARAQPPILGELLRFLCVGGSATGLQYGLLIAGVRGLGIAPVLASSVAYALSTLYNYWANHTFTFRSTRCHRSALPRFLVMAGVGMGLNAAIVWLAYNQCHLHYLMAQLLATALTLIWNFLASRHWAFATPPQP